MYKEILKEEGLQWLDFSMAISRWKTLYQCTEEEANNKVINCLDERLIKRLGAFAKDNNKKLNISMAFRPFSYQENLAPNNGGKYNGYSESKSLIDNLKAWRGVNTAVCANPGASNHNTGAAVDANSSWFESVKDADLKVYGLTKNVQGEWWHVVVLEMASVTSYNRVQTAIDKGYEPQICPCQTDYAKGKYNKEGVSVALTQARLKALGYTITIDGFFGEKTKAVVVQFQKDNGLTPDGIVGGKTIAKLFSSAPIVYTVARLLKFTSPYIKGDDVKWLQTKLNEKGYNCGTVDGIFGEKTKSALTAYQRATKLTVDGIAGKQTVTSLGGNFEG